MPPLSAPGNVADLGDIGNVDLTGLENGNGIVFDDGTGTWGAGEPDGEFYQLGGTQAGGAASGYTSNGVETNPENTGGSVRSDIWWREDGLYVATMRGSSPRISQYDVFPAFAHDGTPTSDWTPLPAFTGGAGIGTQSFGMQFNPTGLELSITNIGSSGFIRVFPMSVAFDVTTLSNATSLFFIGSGSLTRHKWHPNLKRFWVQSGLVIREFSTVDPFKVDSPNPVAIQDFDFFTDAGNIRGWVFSFDGIFLYASRSSDERLVSWQMSVPYDLSTVTVFDDTGPLLNTGNNFQRPGGFYFREGNGDIIMGDELFNIPVALQDMQTLST
jgi:hypothetical protein